MKRLGWIGVLAAAALVSVVVWGSLRPAQSSVSNAAEVGHTAPGFVLPNIQGQSVSLQSYRGRTVLLNFFATWCIPCRTEIPLIERVYKRRSADFAVLMIDKAEPASDVRAFSAGYGLSVSPLLDSDLRVWRQYHVNLQPVSVWIDRKGVVRIIHYGPMDLTFLNRTLDRLRAA